MRKPPYYYKAQKIDGKTKLEREYEAYLGLRLKAGEIESFAFEPLTFRLAKNTIYKPDFMVTFPDYVAFYETKPGVKDKKTGVIKAWSMDDGYKTKIKVAAELYPQFAWRITWPDKGKGWGELEL